MSSWSEDPRTLEGVKALAESLRSQFAEEQLERLRDELCPGEVALGDPLEDALLYWVGKTPNPTIELLQEKLQTIVPEIKGGYND